MDLGLIAGIGGLIVGGFSIYVALYALGYFQYLGGKKRTSITPVSKEELMKRIFALNEASKPYQVVKGEDCTFIAEWKIVDAKWWGIFNKNNLSEAYRAFLLLDEGRYSVRCFEELVAIKWVAGVNGFVPHISYQKSFFRGRILYKKEVAKGYGIKQLRSLEAGKIFDYKFDINEIRGPLIHVVETSGWEWVPVTAKRHVMFQNSK